MAAVLAAGGINAIVAALRTHSLDVNVARHCGMALAVFCITENVAGAGARMILTADAVPALASALCAHSDVIVRVYCIVALAYSEGGSAALLDAGAAAMLVAALSGLPMLQPIDEQFAVILCQATACFCAFQACAPAFLAEPGAAAALIAMVRRFSDNVTIAEFGAGTLGNLCRCPGGACIVVALGGREAVAAAGREHPGSERVHEQVSRTLGYMAAAR